jgi:hypothetical protein
MKKFLHDYLDDVLFIAGCVVILYGLAQLNTVLTWIAGGVMLIGFGLMVGKAKI